MTPRAQRWLAHNQELLVAHIERIRLFLQRRVDREDGEAQVGEASQGAEMPPALRSLCEAFSLSAFERDVLLLCAGIELDPALAAQCAAAQGDPALSYPTFGLALAALPDPEWAALCPSGPLRRYRLVELLAGSTVCQSPLRIDERVLHYIVGLSQLDERLQGIVTRVPEPLDLPPSHRDIAREVIALWSHSSAGRPMVQLCGADHHGARDIAAAACAGLGLALHAVRAADVPVAPGEREAFCALWEREARLEGSAVLVRFDDRDGPEARSAALSFAERAGGPMFVCTREPLSIARGDAVRLFVERPTMAEQRSLWLEMLGPLAGRVNGQIDRIVSHFDLGRPVIHAAIVRSVTAGEDGFGPALWEACRREARPQLDDLAQRIEPRARWDDLVLPAAQKEMLREIAAQQRQRATVCEAWGFAERSSRGLGATALFCGSSGTGKTMAAEVLASELRLDLCRIDLSRVVSKYIGETEKNLRRVFDAAESGSAILLFDEADALFGKRSEVKDSHDRHANIEVSYLLQRMEAYRGIAILTTNMKRALDPAFLRRIRFIVDFPFPGDDERREIWRRAFPPATPTEGIDAHRLSRLPIAGGNIRNIALNAAFLAADAGEPVRMSHLATAARRELAKLEKPLDEREIRGWT